MSDAYGYGESGRYVFDAQLLEETAARFRERSPAELLDELQRTLMPRVNVGSVPGATEAGARLRQVYDSMKAELERAGIDFLDLASRTLAAGELARQAEEETRAAARSGPS
jgi:hypothetical protein